MRIATIHVEAWRAAYQGIVADEYLQALSIEQRYEGWRRILGLAEESVWVAEKHETTVGWISASRSRDDDAGQSTGEIWAVYVDPSWWRKGVGRALCGAAEDELVKRGCSDVTLWVLEANERGLRFYDRIGYVRDACADRTEHRGGQVLIEVRLRKKLER